MKIKKGDTVLIITGKDRGRTGKILRAFPKERTVLIEGINLRKKHMRPKRSGEKGQIVEIPGPINISNVKLICPKCGKAVRIGYKLEGKNPKGVSPSAGPYGARKYRVCKKCEKEI